MTRTAPVDLPQPRKPPEGYVEMSFKPGAALEQNYINMTLGATSTRTRRRPRPGSRKDKSQRSQPIAIQAFNKPSKAPSFLPLNGSCTSESLASTPASPHATPTGSNSTIFPFSLNSPQSPIKPFAKSSTSSDYSPEECGDYALMTPISPLNSLAINTIENPEKSVEPLPKNILNESPLSPLSKRLTELAVTKKKSTRNTTSPLTIATKDDTNSAIKLANETTKSLKREREYDKPPSPINKDPKSATITTAQELPQSPVMKKLSELSVSKTKLIGCSPNTSPTPTNSAGLKVNTPKSNSPKIADDITPTPIATPTPSPSPLDSEGYEKLQPGATLLHYASLDLPEALSAPPVSPTPVADGFRYAEIDFAKLKQN